MKFYLILVPFLFFSCVQENDLKKNNLKGKVKILIEREYIAIEKFGEPETGKLISIKEFEFDSIGNIVRYRRDNKYEETKLFDEKGNVKEINKFVLENYYSENLLFINKIVNKYNSDNKLIETSTYNSIGDLENKKTYLLNNDNKIIEINELNPSSLKNNIIIKFNDKNKVLEYLEKTSDKNEIFKANFKYDSLNRKTKEIWFLDRKPFITKSFKYNKEGKLIEEKESIDEIDIRKKYYAYNINGKLIEKKICRYDDSVLAKSKYNYIEKKIIYKLSDYDNENNWLTRVRYEDDKLTRIIKRNISYYSK